MTRDTNATFEKVLTGARSTIDHVGLDASHPAGASRVAIIEDDDELTLLLRYNLEAVGFRIECSADGGAALLRLLQSPPDIVVLDWGLPGLSGIELLRQMRRLACFDGLPVLMLTARTAPEDRRYALMLGADAYMTKPFAIHELIGTLGRLLHAR
jgi:two-component system, OmpR family, phosphate regulon response regulator PhoB